MAHIEIRNLNEFGGTQLVINGVDFTKDTYRGIQLVEVCPEAPEFAEVGLQVTFVVSRLDLDNEADVQITDRLPSVATRVRSMTEGND